MFNQLVREKNTNKDTLLIDEWIEERSLVQKYGQNFLNVVKVYSRKDFDMFKEFIDTIDFAIKSAEKETNKAIEIALFEEFPYSAALKDDLTHTLNGVLVKIRMDKYQKIKDPKAYLFVSIKETVRYWINQIHES